jgi:hypothetical protein
MLPLYFGRAWIGRCCFHELLSQYGRHAPRCITQFIRRNLKPPCLRHSSFRIFYVFVLLFLAAVPTSYASFYHAIDTSRKATLRRSFLPSDPYPISRCMPATFQTAFLASNIVLAILATVFVAARFTAKYMKKCRGHSDDFLLLVALVDIHATSKHCHQTDL